MRFSGKGDSGYTGLIGGERVPKYDLRPEACGALDEATSALGLAKANCPDDRTRELIERVQQDIYMAMGELATPPSGRHQFDYQTPAAKVEELELWIDELQDEVRLENKFILPGATVTSAAIDLARTIVRRAERPVAKLIHAGQVENEYVLAYLNRLSSLLFVLARYEEAKEQIAPTFAARPKRGQRTAGQ